MLSIAMKSVNVCKIDLSKLTISEPIVDNRGNKRQFINYDGERVFFRTRKFNLKFGAKPYGNSVAVQWFLSEEDKIAVNRLERHVNELLGKDLHLVKTTNYGDSMRFKVKLYDEEIKTTIDKVVNGNSERIKGMSIDDFTEIMTRNSKVNVLFSLSIYSTSLDTHFPATSELIRVETAYQDEELGSGNFSD